MKKQIRNREHDYFPWKNMSNFYIMDFFFFQQKKDNDFFLLHR